MVFSTHFIKKYIYKTINGKNELKFKQKKL